MIALDTNVLVYAHRPEVPQHERARACVEALAAGQDRWALPWSVCHELVAVVTRPTREVEATPLAVALALVEQLLQSRHCVALAEPPDHWGRFSRVAVAGDVAGRRIYDARIAATCLAHGVRELWTADRDYGRFPALKVRNPLVG
jgi:toxin-antitoxin system PIN domain toxin